ncbi:MAG: hypothetical protein V9G09_13190 [Candidatus Nanopelagicales bacterium]
MAAKQAGYANRSGAFKAFWKAMDHREAEAVEDHRALELARLDALQVPLWEKAMNGDVKAAGHGVEDHRNAQPAARAWTRSTVSVRAAQTVVMSPAEVAAWNDTQSGEHASSLTLCAAA